MYATLNILHNIIILNDFTFRLLLAALHFNENSNRAQAQTLRGEKRFKICFPKYKQGGYAVRQVKVDQTFSELQHFTTPSNSIYTCMFTYFDATCTVYRACKLHTYTYV